MLSLLLTIHEFKVVLVFLEFGSKEHISDIKLCSSKITKTFSCSAISLGGVVFFRFLLKLCQILVG